MQEIAVFQVMPRHDSNSAWVGNWMLKGHAVDIPVRRHFALFPKEFNPETDEVLIVKKDARRVFVEADGGKEYVHGCSPTWHDNCWAQDHGGNFSYLKERVFGIVGDDLVEFVAVRTHRPPEPEKPVEQTSLTPAMFGCAGVAVYLNNPTLAPSAELETDEQKVKRAYPRARWAPQTAYGWIVSDDAEKGDRISAAVGLGHRNAECMAWTSAASQIARERATPPVNADDLGSFSVDTREVP